MNLKLKVLLWQKKNLEKIVEKLRVKFSSGKLENVQIKLLLKYEDKIQSINQKIKVEELKELQE